MSGIPTDYNGVRFRSRVEAKWAFCFDALGIGWKYEPVDLDGYIPDFVFDCGLLVEIKHDISDETMRAAQVKIEHSGWTGEAAILTPVGPEDSAQPLVGTFGETEDGPDGKQIVWGDCRVMRCTNCGKVSLFSGCGSWLCRECRSGEGNAHIGPIGHELTAVWSEAGNRFQWRASNHGLGK